MTYLTVKRLEAPESLEIRWGGDGGIYIETGWGRGVGCGAVEGWMQGLGMEYGV